MENTDVVRPMTLTIAARWLGVEPQWLRAEAEAGRIPHVKAGRTILFNENVLAKVLSERAAVEGVR